MVTDEQQYAAAVVAVAQSQVGYQPGRTWSKYGQWYGSPNALWCDCGATWCDHEALGRRAAHAINGAQPHAPNGRGFAWTVRHREWLQKNGTQIPLANARAGDYLFFKYPTSDPRNNNPVNHVDRVRGSATSTYIPTIGFNTPQPGTPGDPSNGRGVWRHNRALTDRFIVDCYRPPWWRHPDLITYVQGALGQLGYDPGVIDGIWGKRTEAAVLKFQQDTGLVPDKIPGPATRSTLALRIVEHGVDPITEEAELMAAADEIVQRVTDALATVPAATWAYRNPGYPGRDAHGLLRDSGGLRGEVATLAGQVAGLQEAVTQLANKPGAPVDLTAIEEASRRGSEAALESARWVLTNDQED